MRLEDIDINFKIESKLQVDNMRYFDPEQEPFKIFGVFREGESFRRIPSNVAKATSDAAERLCTYTAGGRIRFATDSSFVAVYVEHGPVTEHPHFSALGQSGCDLYENFDGEEIYRGSFMPNIYDPKKYEAVVKVEKRGMRTFTVNLPSYCSVNKIYIGLESEAKIEEPLPYKNIAPIVYYGSSITQGGCASRPGNSYQNIICRKTNIDYVNLGLAGNARGEDSIIEYVASLDMSMFVLDYDYNAPSVEHLKVTHNRFYDKVRTAHKETPIIMLTRPKYRLNNDEIARNKAVRDNYDKAVADGDKNIYFIDGRELMNDFVRETAFVDGIHPTDSGFASIAERILVEMKKANY